MISAVNHSMMPLPTNNAMRYVLPDLRIPADLEMLKFNESAAACTFNRVASDTCSGCAKVRETVAFDTPAFSATSPMLAFMVPPKVFHCLFQPTIIAVLMSTKLKDE